MTNDEHTPREVPNESHPIAPTRPLYWSVRRELWENRSIYIAPLIVAAVQVFGFAISAIGLADRRRTAIHPRRSCVHNQDLQLCSGCIRFS